jgi:hypothetical protein
MTYGKIESYPTILQHLCGPGGWIPPSNAYIIHKCFIDYNNHRWWLIDNYGNQLQNNYYSGAYIVTRGFSEPLSNNYIDILKTLILPDLFQANLPHLKEILSVYIELEQAKKEIERLKKCEVELNLLKFCENTIEREEIKRDLELLQFDTTNTLVNSSEDLL